MKIGQFRQIFQNWENDTKNFNEDNCNKITEIFKENIGVLHRVTNFFGITSDEQELNAEVLRNTVSQLLSIIKYIGTEEYKIKACDKLLEIFKTEGLDIRALKKVVSQLGVIIQYSKSEDDTTKAWNELLKMSKTEGLDVEVLKSVVEGLVDIIQHSKSEELQTKACDRLLEIFKTEGLNTEVLKSVARGFVRIGRYSKSEEIRTKAWDGLLEISKTESLDAVVLGNSIKELVVISIESKSEEIRTKVWDGLLEISKTEGLDVKVMKDIVRNLAYIMRNGRSDWFSKAFEEFQTKAWDRLLEISKTEGLDAVVLKDIVKELKDIINYIPSSLDRHDMFNKFTIKTSEKNKKKALDTLIKIWERSEGNFKTSLEEDFRNIAIGLDTKVLESVAGQFVDIVRYSEVEENKTTAWEILITIWARSEGDFKTHLEFFLRHINTTRPQFVLPEALQRDAITELVEDRQSTHQVSVHSSVAESLNKLQARYQLDDPKIAEQIESLRKFLFEETIPEIETSVLDSAQTCYTKLVKDWGRNTTEGRTKMDMLKVLALIWQGVNDVSDKTEGHVNERRRNFVRVLNEIQNEYGKDSSACVGGSFNALVSSLNGIHPDVTIARFNSGIVSEIVQEATKDTFKEKSVEEQQSIKKIREQDSPEKKDEEKLQNFYNECTEVVKTRVKELGGEFKEDGLYIGKELIIKKDDLDIILNTMEYVAI